MRLPETTTHGDPNNLQAFVWIGSQEDYDRMIAILCEGLAATEELEDMGVELPAEEST